MHARTHTHTHTHTEAPTHMSIRTIKNLIYTKLKWAANRDLRWMKTPARNRKYGRSIVLGKEVS